VHLALGIWSTNYQMLTVFILEYQENIDKGTAPWKKYTGVQRYQAHFLNNSDVPMCLSYQKLHTLLRRPLG
jgi:hypothetical protein